MLIIDEGHEMCMDKGETGRYPEPLEPFGPERPWPTPTPGVPVHRRREQDRTLNQILDKLVDIEKRLERIEDLLNRRSQ